MKSKLKTAISFGETVDVTAAMETLLFIQDFIIALYEEEAMETWAAHEEANKLIFSKPFYALSGYTVAQWIAVGGSEKKVLEVIKDLIGEAIKESHKMDEQKFIMAKIFNR